MKKINIKEKIEHYEAFLNLDFNHPHNLEKRDETLLSLLKKFSTLPEKQQEKLIPVLDRTIERHKEVKRQSKIFNYYFNNYELSLNIDQR